MGQRLRRWIRLAACGLIGFSLSACDVLPITGEAPNLYNLTPKSEFLIDIDAVKWQLLIEEPLAAGGLDTNRIALRPTQTELKYFSGARWTERAPRMVQTLLVESFENSKKIVAVGRQVIGLRADYTLKTELREFQAEYFGGTPNPSISVKINAKVVFQSEQKIIGSASFDARQTATGTTIVPIINAYDAALGKVIKRLVKWTLETAQGFEYYERRSEFDHPGRVILANCRISHCRR